MDIISWYLLAFPLRVWEDTVRCVPLAYTERTAHYSGFGQMIMRGLNGGRTISDAAFGMFRATVEETESTVTWKFALA